MKIIKLNNYKTKMMIKNKKMMNNNNMIKVIKNKMKVNNKIVNRKKINKF